MTDLERRYNELKKKSEQYIKSAALQICNKFYAASVHSSYYGCYQLIIYYILSKGIKTKDELDYITNRRGSHNNVINLFFTLVDTSYNELKNLNGKITDLKIYRTEADYSERKFHAPEVHTHLDDAEKFTNEVKNKML